MMRFALFSLLLVSTAAWAANFDNPVEGIFRSVTGDSIGVEVGSKVSKSPDAGPSSGVILFQVNSNTGLRNFRQLSDLTPGRRVLVQYQEDPNGKMKRPVATMITDLGPQLIAPASTTTVVAPAEQLPPPSGPPEDDSSAEPLVITPQTVTTSGNSQTTTTTTTTTTIVNSE